MGIRSTKDITFNAAISRITHVAQIILSRNYRELKAVGFEEIAPEDIIDDEEEQALAKRIQNADLTTWTDQMIEEVIDRPFYRASMFDNYLIKEQA